jgi:hypothetical protein
MEAASNLAALSAKIIGLSQLSTTAHLRITLFPDLQPRISVQKERPGMT